MTPFCGLQQTISLFQSQFYMHFPFRHSQHFTTSLAPSVKSLMPMSSLPLSLYFLCHVCCKTKKWHSVCFTVVCALVSQGFLTCSQHHLFSDNWVRLSATTNFCDIHAGCAYHSRHHQLSYQWTKKKISILWWFLWSANRRQGQCQPDLRQYCFISSTLPSWPAARHSLSFDFMPSFENFCQCLDDNDHLEPPLCSLNLLLIGATCPAW
jgi:hypothetical protein